MKVSLLFVALVALAAPMPATSEPASPGKKPSSVLSLTRSRTTDFLVRLDGETLKPQSRRLALGGHAYAWAFSPDRKRLALGVDGALGLRIVDVRRLKRISRIQTWNGEIAELEWLSPRRIVGLEATGLFCVDPIAKKRIRIPYVGGDILRVERAGNALALVVAPDGAIGPARLVTVGADCRPRAVTLERIRAGAVFDEESGRGEIRRPGLAFDPAGRAFVVGSGGEPVAQVDLATLAVTYHELGQRRSFFERLRDWLEPSAEAKGPIVGSSRQAIWLGEGRIAVTGDDGVPAAGGGVDLVPAGLSLVDTRDWTVELVDRTATEFAFAEGTLLATDVSLGSSGLSAYSPGGERLYQLFEGRSVLFSQSLGGTAYVTPSRQPIHAVDVDSGRILRTLRRMPVLLTADA